MSQQVQVILMNRGPTQAFCIDSIIALPLLCKQKPGLMTEDKDELRDFP
jgi:hypothetical protein